MIKYINVTFILIFVSFGQLEAQSKVDTLNYHLEDGSTPLISAIRKKDLNHVRSLLNNGADPNFPEKGGLEGTPLMYASSINDTSYSKLLIEAGAQINAVDVNNDPALNWATYYGYVQNMKYLIDNGADIKITSKHGASVDVGLRLWHSDSVLNVFRTTTFNQKRNSKERKLLNAVLQKDLETVSKLLDSGVSPNTTDGLKTPVLQLAAQDGDIEIVKLLVNKGANVNALNRVGQSPLAFAARFSRSEVVDFLLAKGADPNATGNLYKLTPLIGAAVGGNITIGEKLLKAGAEINSIDVVNECAALHFAMFYANTDFMEFLLNEGADYNSEVLNKSYTGYTLAKAYGYKSVTALMDKIDIRTNPLLGSWQITKIEYIYTDTTYILEKPYPGRLLVTPRRYSIQYNPWLNERIPFKELSKPTDEEIKQAFQTIVFNTGKYEIKEDVFVTTADIAKVAGFEGGVQYYKFSLDGDNMTFTMFDETYPNGKKPEWFGKLQVKFSLSKE